MIKVLQDWNKGNRVLILYPNHSMDFALPHSISVLSACLKKKGFIIDLFDTTLYSSGSHSDDDCRVIRGQFPHVDVPGVKTSDMFVDFKDKVRVFNPDMIMVSVVDTTVDLACSLLRSLDSHVFTIVGGVSVILDPERFKQYPEFDMVWDGNAEDLLLDNGEGTPFEDYTIFGSERFYRPFSGRLYKTIPFHSERGCSFSCSFCCAERLREKIGYHPVGIDYLIKEFIFQVELHDPEFIHITSETFLDMPVSKLKRFADIFKRYNIPFWCQTHVKTLSEEKVKLLNDMNCFKIALGIECGNEIYRGRVVKKYFSNDEAVSACELLARYGIRVGLNSIIGFPFETKDLMWDTVRLNQVLYGVLVDRVPEVQVNGYTFQPFFGTELRDVCYRFNLLKDSLSTLNSGVVSIVNPFISDDELIFICVNFNRFVRDNISYDVFMNDYKPSTNCMVSRCNLT